MKKPLILGSIIVLVGLLVVGLTTKGELFDRHDDEDESSAGGAAAPIAEAPAPAPAAGTSVVFNFDSDQAGGVPAGFHTALTGGGGAVEWAVKPEPPRAP